MILSLFRKDPAKEAALALFAEAAGQARAPAFYADLGVADDVEGRFELLTLHVYLILRRLKGQGDEAARVAQKLFDATFASFDDALRELGVGDLAVGRRIRKMAEAFYGRIGAYEAALAADAAPAALVDAVARNVYGDPEAAGAPALAAYVRQAAAMIDAHPVSRLIAGVARFPEAPCAGPGSAVPGSAAPAEAAS
ncbi:ubiquinol-cytochrome C chaperone family protein [Amphiplicatus metriothermophilus]|uniref:Cytochrome b pre-mRNA-processing protein 3 n=1 Tax=Amphiplicatus metriothermophilus TaxID=1519374 RepID=A0A239PPD4_9PROT|nr:ubiquinol-cytochrome C chaperone family protein [Amphiplicatus metriothermophilus]MBB5518837.1 cytochrome b pre-mRNA-processing protein 3 [Amphiplicatus metriothermophilus]SNT72010.1 cytochrome b pre-mRNA-processing protein 3 [Amphiplicatus metriothermophilus]